MRVMSTTVRSSPLALTVLGILHTQPLHPYGIQRLIKQWGKDQVVNVGQRASLYRTIDCRARLDEVHGSGVQQATEVQQGRHVLPRGDRVAAGAAYLREAVLVFRFRVSPGNGSLVPRVVFRV